MSEDSEAGLEQQSESRRTTPGRLLREARESRTFSVRQVANNLHLTMHYVHALESDEFDKLPGDVFVRGYIRSYAQLLELDPDRILKHYREYTERRQARKEEAFKRYTRQRNDRNRPWVIISGVVFVVLAVFLWYLSDREGQPANNAGPGSPASETPSAEEADVQQLPEQGEQTAGGSSEESTASGSRSVTGDPVTTDGLTLDWGGPDILEFLFTAESRVRVRAAGNQADSVLLEEGDLLRVEGRAPFDVVIDRAAGVLATFNGRDVDVRSHAREDGSARLTIGIQ